MKCRFCPVTIPAYYKGKDGRTRSGWGEMNRHIESFHPGHAEDLEERRLKAEAQEREDEERRNEL